MLNIIFAFLPLLSTVGCLVLYPLIYPINQNITSYINEHGIYKFTVIQPGFLSFPFILLCVLPVMNHTISLRWWMIIFGILFVDTVEYWRHRVEHFFPLVYKHTHKEHHQQRPMTTIEGFRNQYLDMILPLVPFVTYLYITNMTFIETMILTSLSLIATYADHTLTGDVEYDRKKFHNVHHTSGWNENFQQPFFSYWDIVCGTVAENTIVKYNPFVP
jgi:sterol desaturase/sphingolipid hydroxylase (fatty acid hydroxylase superfamily)